MSHSPVPLSPALLERLASARLLALDVDGTLTDGRVVYVGAEELQAFCVRDGQGLAWLAQAGVVQAWITGRGCAATERRAAELGVTELHLRSGPKDEVLAAIQERLGIAPAETVAMGDDLPDLALGLRAAVFVCPGDARTEVREQADLVTAAPGGSGAVRELAEAILRAKELWEPTQDRYGRSTV
jgi:3-deoxy-D-manno-octulosonate 8-phosphate phosphatase (KDO 8-P phosphatase)